MSVTLHLLLQRRGHPASRSPCFGSDAVVIACFNYYLSGKLLAAKSVNHRLDCWAPVDSLAFGLLFDLDPLK